MRSVPLWIAAVWWGSLTTLGFFVVPMLFAHLPSPAMAGTMAARLFTVQTAISVVSGMALLMLFRSNKSTALVDIGQSATLFVVGGVLLSLLVEFGVAPHIITRDNLAVWHSVGTGMYVVQWVCAAVVFGKLSKGRGV